VVGEVRGNATPELTKWSVRCVVTQPRADEAVAWLPGVDESANQRGERWPSPRAGEGGDGPSPKPAK
jgi:hypothetical protein